MVLEYRQTGNVQQSERARKRPNIIWINVCRRESSVRRWHHSWNFAVFETLCSWEKYYFILRKRNRAAVVGRALVSHSGDLDFDTSGRLFWQRFFLSHTRQMPGW